MTLVGRIMLDAYARLHAETKKRCDAWCVEVRHAAWKSPAELKRRYPRASILARDRVVFDVGRGHRLGVQVHYGTGVVVVKKVGTHDEYERWGDGW